MIGIEADFILGSVGFKDLRSTYDCKQLIATAAQINPQRLANIAENFQNFRGWASYEANLIISRVYGLDYIIDVNATSERLGFYFTTNPNLVAGELEKFQTYDALWKSLGVTKVIILLFICPIDQGLVFYDKEKSQNNMFGVIMNAIKSDSDIISTTIHLETE